MFRTGIKRAIFFGLPIPIVAGGTILHSRVQGRAKERFSRSFPDESFDEMKDNAAGDLFFKYVHYSFNTSDERDLVRRYWAAMWRDYIVPNRGKGPGEKIRVPVVENTGDFPEQEALGGVRMEKCLARAVRYRFVDPELKKLQCPAKKILSYMKGIFSPTTHSSMLDNSNPLIHDLIDATPPSKKDWSPPPPK